MSFITRCASADQLHGERLLCSQYLQEGANTEPAPQQQLQQTTTISTMNIQDMAAAKAPSMAQSIDTGEV